MEQARGRVNDRVRQAAVSVALLAVWLVCRPYLGIVHDSRIYIGRALADLDPTGIGRDIAFALDSQSQFSFFPAAARWFVALLGAGFAAISLALVGLIAWFACAAYFVSRFAHGRRLAGLLICVAALPSAYGGYETFHWGEPFATPRLFAEAICLAALGLWIDGRTISAAGCTLVAGLLHPLITLPIAAVIFVLACFKDPRWLLLAGAALLFAIFAAWSNVPIAGRLFELMDPLWRQIASTRAPYLFPSLWPAASWSLLICQFVTLGTCWLVSNNFPRPLVLAAVLVAAVSTIISTLLPTVLIVQLQLWRALWLVSFLAASAFGVSAIELVKRGARGHAALAWLGCAWVDHNNIWLVVISSVLLVATMTIRASPVAWRVIRILSVSFFGFWTVVVVGVFIAATFAVYSQLPAADWLSLRTAFATKLPAVLIVATGVAIGVAGLPSRWSKSPLLQVVSAAVLATLVAIGWDARSVLAKAREDGSWAAGLRARMTSGTVQWVDSPGTTWLWTRRPEWWSERQGASTIFNRSLALEWSRRLDVLIRAGLALPQDRGVSRDDPMAPRPVTILTRSSLVQLCSAADGPDWVVAPAYRLDPSARAAAMFLWRAPFAEPYYSVPLHHWQAAQLYTLSLCSELRNRPR